MLRRARVSLNNASPPPPTHHYKERILAMCQHYAPAKLHRLDPEGAIAAYGGDGGAVMAALTAKYGPEPNAPRRVSGGASFATLVSEGLRSEALLKGYTSRWWMTLEDKKRVVPAEVRTKVGERWLDLHGCFFLNAEQTTDPAAVALAAMACATHSPPRSAMTGAEYPAHVTACLVVAAATRGYTQPWWLTTGEVRRLGRGVSVRPGEEGVIVPYPSKVWWCASQLIDPSVVIKHVGVVRKASHQGPCDGVTVCSAVSGLPLTPRMVEKLTDKNKRQHDLPYWMTAAQLSGMFPHAEVTEGEEGVLVSSVEMFYNAEQMNDIRKVVEVGELKL